MSPAADPAPTIRPLRDDEKDELARRVAASWGSALVTSRGVGHLITDLPCLLATDGDRWLGVCGYRFAGDECEVVLLEAFERHCGVGTALLTATLELARRLNSRRLWLVTSNANLEALRFYQRRGMHLVRVWPDAIAEARMRLKPEIPPIGEFGIAIRDELELEIVLRDADDPSGDRAGRRGTV
jgi:GNAT superfamily N-acetyltransferase